MAEESSSSVKGAERLYEHLLQRNMDTILDCAKTQPSPLKDRKDYNDFFDTMSDVWHVADKYNLDIPFTNLLMFGPQSSGKTTITERILGFPVAVVKTEIGTTRPMVLTTRRSDVEEYKVKGGADREFQLVPKEAIMNWVKIQMEDTGTLLSGRPKISSERIFIEACGPQYKNRRFVDLPGFQSNDENGREDILDLLRTELDNPNTVVVCVEDSKVEFANSNLVLAFKAVLGNNFVEEQNLAGRFVLVLNKTDSWLSDAGVSKSPFISRISTYVEKCGLVPILVGSSVDMANKTLRRARAEGAAEFDQVVREYHEADAREERLYSERFADMQLPPELEGCLSEKFRGFGALLRTVDALVINRDKSNAKWIENKMVHIRNSAEKKIENLERQHLILSGNGQTSMNRESKKVIKDLLKFTSEVATDRWGQAGAYAAMDLGEIERYGNDALTEELEFVFGDRNAVSIPSLNKRDFKGYYDPTRAYPVLSGGTAVNLPEEVYSNWQREMYSTVRKLESKGLPGISRLDHKLLNGQLYKRAFALWSSSVYRLVAPSADDLKRLPNLMGINPRNIHGSSDDKAKAQRLAEIYILRLTPAINFLCQKVEFLLLKNFDTATRVFCRQENRSKAFVEAIGNEDFTAEVRDHFQKVLHKKTELVYDKCFNDLKNEVLRLFPYAASSASATGLQFAYPEVSRTVSQSKEKLKVNIREQLRKFFPDGYFQNTASSFIQGVEHGAIFLSEASALNPLFFAVLQVAVHLLQEVTAKDQGSNYFESTAGEDLELLGFVACLYANVLPSFIETVDARVRGDLWACVEDNDLIADLEESIVASDLILGAKDKIQGITEEIAKLQEEAQEVNKTSKSLMKIVNKYPSMPMSKLIHRKRIDKPVEEPSSVTAPNSIDEPEEAPIEKPVGAKLTRPRMDPDPIAEDDGQHWRQVDTVPTSNNPSDLVDLDTESEEPHFFADDFSAQSSGRFPSDLVDRPIQAPSRDTVKKYPVTQLSVSPQGVTEDYRIPSSESSFQKKKNMFGRRVNHPSSSLNSAGNKFDHV